MTQKMHTQTSTNDLSSEESEVACSRLSGILMRNPLTSFGTIIAVCLVIAIVTPGATSAWIWLGERTKDIDRESLEKLNFIGIWLQGSLGVAAALAGALVAIVIATAAHRISEDQSKLQKKMALHIKNTFDREQVQRLSRPIQVAYEDFVELGNCLDDLFSETAKFVAWAKKNLKSVELSHEIVDGADFSKRISEMTDRLVMQLRKLKNDPLAFEIWTSVSRSRQGVAKLFLPELLDNGHENLDVRDEPVKIARFLNLNCPIVKTTRELLDIVKTYSNIGNDQCLGTLFVLAYMLGDDIQFAAIHDIVIAFPVGEEFEYTALKVMRKRYQLGPEQKILEMLQSELQSVNPSNALSWGLRNGIEKFERIRPNPKLTVDDHPVTASTVDQIDSGFPVATGKM